MMDFNGDELGRIRTFPQLVKYLRDVLGWPIETDQFDDLTFDYEAEELGIDRKNAAKVQEIKQLRPLVTNQPWGIFFVKFEPKRLPVVALRRILGQLVIKKRASAKRAEQAAWQPHDLLFISAYGEGDERQINLAHFSEGSERGDLPTLKVLGWDGDDTKLKLDHVAHELHTKLCWPDDEANINGWRQQWAAAFTLGHREVITTSQRLAVRLADLAADIRRKVNAALAVESEQGPLRKLMHAFQEALIHDLKEDHFAVDFEVEPLRERLREFCDVSVSSKDVATRFNLKTTPNWDLGQSRKAIANEGLKQDLFTRYLFHCFDWRITYYSDYLVTRSRRPVMRHMWGGNLAFITLRQVKGEPWAHAFVSTDISNKFTLSSKSSNVSYHFPLFLAGDDAQHSLALSSEREPNFAPAFLKALSTALNIPQKAPHVLPTGLTPEDIFHYTYAVFHSPGYRSRYGEFLKIDFPRLPLTGDLVLFRALARLGGELVALHLLESLTLDQHVTTFVGSMKSKVDKVTYADNTVWLDKAKTLGFQGVPEDVWNFHIGGYQVCQKWLKDRKGRMLSKEDVEHYHRVVVALSETSA